jgi:ribosomal protein S18 acetylase RimI-like enzyme
VIRLRPIRDADGPFLRRLYASTREAEMQLVSWTDGEKVAFLDQQFEAQHRCYQKQFSAASFDVVEADGEPVGRLYVDRRVDELRIIDIALLPGWRRRGLGGALLTAILDEAEAAGKAVRIHVERNNPALRLYERLGFERREDQGLYYLMERCAVTVVGRSREAVW